MDRVVVDDGALEAGRIRTVLVVVVVQMPSRMPNLLKCGSTALASAGYGETESSYLRGQAKRRAGEATKGGQAKPPY